MDVQRELKLTNIQELSALHETRHSVTHSSDGEHDKNRQ